MRRETLLERKQFAADLAERDAQTARERAEREARIAAACVEARPPERQVELVVSLIEQPDRYRRRTASDVDAALAYKMRRWWLDRYTLDEIRELAVGLVHLERAA